MYLKAWHPLDRKTAAEASDIDDIVDEAEDQCFSDPLKLRLLTLGTERTDDPSADKAGQQDQKSDECLQALGHVPLFSLLGGCWRDFYRGGRTVIYWCRRLIS